MTATTYEERLRTFAEGKRLGRLTKAVRNPEDSVCDACGSALPRTLFGLKDTVSDRCYFVGQSCLTSLVASGLVARARYRQSAEVAYRREMETRQDGASLAGLEPTSPVGVQGDLHDQTSKTAQRRTVIVAESEGHHTVLVRLNHGRRSVTARAREPRFRQEWLRHNGAVVLEPVRRPRRAALFICALGAYARALAAWDERTGPDSDGRANKMAEEVET